ncbi:MAG TPA: DMT family transporter, partial [Cellvibrio sp.]|nr:DMT family transporter [Cellvibrio sp.]
MAVFLAYVLVVLIWATTPLAIQWSSDSISFIAAALARMMIAVAFALPIVFALRRQLFPPGAWKVYLAGSIGIFPNMPVVYWAAQFIPSGLVAVIFAMSPFVTGVLSLLILRENPFTLRRLMALVVALSGLLVIFYGQLRIDRDGIYGIGGILLSCLLFSFSSVWMKRLNENTEAFAQMTGS